MPEPGNSIILTALVYFGRPSDVFDFKTANFTRGWLTRAARALADLVHEKVDKVELVEAIADFDKRMDALDNILELIEVELDGDELFGGHREGGRFPRCLSETADGGQAAVERYFHHPRRRR